MYFTIVPEPSTGGLLLRPAQEECSDNMHTKTVVHSDMRQNAVHCGSAASVSIRVIRD